MVKSFSIAKKPRVLFGVGLTTEAPKELKKAGCKNIFVLSDPVLKKMGAFQPLYDALDSEGLDYVICDEFDRDPTDVMVNHVASIAVEAKIDGIIGIGGGATMDIAKCVNQLIHSEFPINRYLAPDFATPTPGVPLVLIPTTPGTGSETSSALSLIDTIVPPVYSPFELVLPVNEGESVRGGTASVHRQKGRLLPWRRTYLASFRLFCRS